MTKPGHTGATSGYGSSDSMGIPMATVRLNPDYKCWSGAYMREKAIARVSSTRAIHTMLQIGDKY